MSLRFQSPVGVSCDDTGEKRGDDYKFQSPSRGELRLVLFGWLAIVLVFQSPSRGELRRSRFAI